MRRHSLFSTLILLTAVPALAQNLQVLTVPWTATDPTVPHAAYNAHATTFKAIARGGNGTYTYEWDFTGDGTFDSMATTSNRFNLSTRNTYQTQTTSVLFSAKVRVTSGAQTVIASYPVYVFADVPTDPGMATDRQLQVMRNVAIDDGLWFLHTQMTRSGNEADPTTGAQITGNIGGVTTYNAGSYLEALGRNQHYPAFPPAYLGAMPNPQENAQRWATDPYAEDATRLVNYLLSQATVVGIPTTDEVNLTGFYPEVTATPIPGTDDAIGLYIGSSPGDQSVGYCAGALRGLASARLAGYVAQVGDFNRVLGRKLEFIIQQIVDAIVWAQNDSGFPGSWYYFPNTGMDILGEYIAGTNEAVAGLWAADEFMRSAGVIVPNLAKARLISYLFQNSNNCPIGGTGGAATASAANVCDFATSSTFPLALGWVGAHLLSATDSRIAFPGYSMPMNPTLGQLRGLWNSNLLFISNAFLVGSVGQYGWDNGFVEAGDFSRTDGRMNIYAMLQWARTSRAVQPEIVTWGTNDWARLFSRVLIRNQLLDGTPLWQQSNPLGNYNDLNGGNAFRTALMLLTLSPDDQPPVVTATASLTTTTEGTRITFTAQGTAPGTVTWTFGNGDTASGPSVDYTYPDNGMFNVYATVTTPGGSTGDVFIPVTVTNAAPIANAGADVTVDEGTAVMFAGAVTDPGTADTHTFSWNLGDGTIVPSRSTSHPYADNGTFMAALTVNDDDLGTSNDTASVTVRNVAPSITSTPGTTIAAGAMYGYTLTFTDPGTADTQTCSVMTAPMGATLTGCALSWTPAVNQAGAPQAFILCVTDDDLGRTCQSFTVSVTIVDTDSDGLPDSWEQTHFGNLGQTGSGDPDMDGVSNAVELAGNTNPTVFDGPSAPSLPMPACAARVNNNRPTLSVTNATDPQSSALTYEFEVYSDAALTNLVASAGNVAATAGTTQWRVTVPLQEDVTYQWRARARDAFVAGAWTMPVCSFTVDAVNGLPTAPALDMPADGARVSSTTPTLTVRNATDPEGDALTYEFEVYRAGARVANQAGVMSGATTTSWQVTPALMEDTEYTWHARAVSMSGAGSFSANGTFRVNAGNATPPAPTIVSPQNGTVVEALTPRLVFLSVSDPDGDAVVYDWELAAGDSFDAPVASGADVVVTEVAPSAALTEDTRYCWRVRADDGQAQSAWTRACFTVTASDGAPSVPTLINPSSGSTVATLTPVFSWAGAVDPEKAAVLYELELSADGAVVVTLSGLSGNTAVAAEPLTDGKSYSWRVRALAGSGPASEFSAASTFTVKLPEVQMGGGGGCGCGAGGGWAMLPLALAMLLRRRASRR